MKNPKGTQLPRSWGLGLGGAVKAIEAVAGRSSAAPMDQGRSAWRQGASRAEQVALTLKSSGTDPDFLRDTAAADAARDEGRWSDAEALYRRALDRYPLHHGYRVQHAHMCKEQGRLHHAEIGYRDALALGGPPPDIQPHLDFVAARQGVSGAAPTGDGPKGPMGERPCVRDLNALGYLFWRDDTLSDDDTLKFLRLCASCDAVAARMIRDDRFIHRNGPFLLMMRSRR